MRKLRCDMADESMTSAPTTRRHSARRAGATLAAWAMLLGCTAAWGQASDLLDVGRIEVNPQRGWVLADDTDSVVVEINVLDSEGSPVPDGTEVSVTTSAGRLEETLIQTTQGVARVRLFSGGESEKEARITAFVGVKRSERQAIVLIQREAGEDDIGSKIIRVKAEDYLAFFDRGAMVHAMGKARFEYRRLKIEAESLQFCVFQPYCLRACNATVSNGKQEFFAKWLYLEFRGPQTNGVAMLTEPNYRKFEFVDEDFKEQQWFYPDDPWRMAEVGDSNLVVRARDIMLFPDEKLVFRSARIYYEDVHILTMSAHIIPLSGAGTAGGAFPQVVGFTYPGGVFVDYPWYFMTTEHHTGALRLRHGTPAGVYTGRTGWYVDAEFEYTNGSDSSGQIVVDGIGQKDVGARWSHNKAYGPDAYASYSLSWPQHRYLSGYANYTKVNSGNTQMLSGSWFSGAGIPRDWMLESTWRFNAKRFLGMSLGTGASIGVEEDSWVDGAFARAGVSANLKPAKPWKVIGNLTFSPRISGSALQRSNGEREFRSVIGADANLRFSRMGTLRVSYDIQNTDGARYMNGTRHYLRGSLTYFTSGSNPWSVMLSASQDLTNDRLTAYGYMNWEFIDKWCLMATGTLNRTTSYSYQDYSVGIGRRIGQAELRLVYSADTDRVEFEFTRAGSYF